MRNLFRKFFFAYFEAIQMFSAYIFLMIFPSTLGNIKF